MNLDLETKEHIRDLKAKYCRYVDTKQFDEWEKLFKKDVKIIFYDVEGNIFAEFNSIKEFSSLTRELFATTKTIHQTHNSEMELISQGKINAIWSMEDWHIYAPQAESTSKTMHGYGFYHEQWELDNGEWKIARIELKRNILIFT